MGLMSQNLFLSALFLLSFGSLAASNSLKKKRKPCYIDLKVIKIHKLTNKQKTNKNTFFGHLFIRECLHKGIQNGFQEILKWYFSIRKVEYSHYSLDISVKSNVTFLSNLDDIKIHHMFLMIVFT